MAIQIGEDQREDDLVSMINTTPLVDVMLVLLIIFLITIPVVVETIPLELPKETTQEVRIKPDNLVISVKHDGTLFWNRDPLRDALALADKLDTVSIMEPQPEVHIRGDRAVAYESVGRVISACQHAGIEKVGFVTEPELRPE
jgi:biopolymer transport protein ExbD